MAADASNPFQLPPDLQARLDAAGVHDDATFQAALAADPQLRAEFEAFLRANPETSAAAQMNTLLQAFTDVRDSAQMLAFWRGVPSDLEEPFMLLVEQVIVQAQAAGDADTVNHLASRLEGFRQICAEATQQAQTPPVVQALFAFVQAADDAAAAAVFAENHTLLQPYEAQRLLDEQFRSENAEGEQQLSARRDLLRRLRGAAPPLADAHGSDDSPLAPRPSQLHGDLYQAQEQHFQSAIADRGGVATVVNNIYVQSIERRWSRPTPPALRRDAVARPHEMAQIKAALAVRGGVAITGEAVAPTPTPAIHRTPSLAVQGMAGVGKTVLAYLLAQELDAAYADGVIWETLGPDFTTPAQTQAVLRTWAGYATNFFELDDNAQRAFTFEAAAVRTLLAEHPHLLVVLDNVWSLDAIKPLQEALPPGVHLVITTRSAEIARGLGAGHVEIGRLSDDEAAALVALRLGWLPRRDAPADAWLFALIEGIGGHALGLDVALGVLQREGGGDRGEWQAAAQRLLAAIRRGDLGDLTLGNALDHNVQAVLLYSVRTLDAETQRRFRRSGAFAPDALFTTDDMAAVWGCDADSARRTLVAFANAALVERAAEGGGRWRQHALLRSLALALLRAAGEEEAAAHAHARAYADAMRAAHDAQRYHELLPAMPQLRHAMTWAQANDLETALAIADSSANLQKQFGLVVEAGEWSEQILAAAQARATPAMLGRAHGHRATILSYLATLPGEDRHQRLYAALAAYDDALRFRRPDNVPLAYATIQNNRATISSALATMPGEDRRQRLYDALAAYDDALRFRRPDNAPFDYAQTQNNRANLLSDLATLLGEDRRQRLYDALAAYDDALRFFRPDNAPLDYAQTQNNRATLLRDLATLPGEDRHQRLYAALAAYDDALRFIHPDNAPLDYAQTQNNRANLSSDLATLPGEDRRQHLYDALAAYDDALRFRRPDNAPLDYAQTQNNRGLILSDLATLPGEDRHQRLYAALAAYDNTLRFIRPDNAPFDYAITQNNRGLLLSYLATLSGEDRRQRLYDALAAYDDALRFIRPDNVPLAYATIQNNRATILSDLATLLGEDRRQRLYAALAAYDDALRFIRPDNAPLDYAGTQNNRATILSALATMPGEDRRQRLYDALAAYDDALRFRRPDNAPFDYAITQNNRGLILSDLATMPGEDRRQRLYDALAAYDNTLRFIRPDNAPLDYAMTQNNRGLLLRDLATLPGEDRRQRLHAALAAYDDALRFRRPDNDPLDYAQTQNNRGLPLRDLATLPGEDRRQRLYDALAAYDDALRFIRPDNAPLDYAQTQNNRATILFVLATMPGQDRRQRFYDALAAYDDALRFRRPDNAPFDYAMTQNNRGLLLSDLATLPGENRRQRLYDALAAYDEALRFRRPDNTPLDYAQTQNNRATLLSDLATLPGEDRRGRLYDALHCAVVAVSLFEQFQQAQYLEIGRRVLRSLRTACGDDFPALWAELGLGALPDWLTEASDDNEPAPALPADLQARLAAAGVTDEASLQAALENDPTLRADFEAFLQQNPQLAAAMQMNALLQAFVAVQNTEEMLAFWRSVPSELEQPMIEAVELLIAQAQQAGDDETVKLLQSRLDGFREICVNAARTVAQGEPLLAQLQAYQAQLAAADAETPQVEPWRGVTQAGEALLALQEGSERLLDWDAVRRQVASDYNTFGNALDNAGDKVAALAAFERAVALQPEAAMWRRNQTATLIELGRLDEAAAALAIARNLEPDALRLAQLDAELAAARGKEE